MEQIILEHKEHVLGISESLVKFDKGQAYVEVEIRPVAIGEAGVRNIVEEAMTDLARTLLTKG